MTSSGDDRELAPVLPTAGGPTEKRPAEIAAMFDAIAAQYDRLNHILSVGFDRRWRARAIQALELTGQELVLDLCTGTADLALSGVLRGKGCAARVVGLDFAHEMLRQGRRKLQRLGERRVALVRADATRIPVASGTVDAVTIGFGIRNVAQPGLALEEIHRVLRPGGRVAILEFAVPRMPGLRAIYMSYFRRVVPCIGRAISRHRTAYSYLPASVVAFLRPDELSKLLSASGFIGSAAHPLTFGVVHLHVATKARRVV